MSNPEASPEIAAKTQLKITSETDWEGFKKQISELGMSSLNHFDQYLDDDRLMAKFFKIRQSNVQGVLETDELLEKQSQWWDEAEAEKDFLRRREDLVRMITNLTPRPEDVTTAGILMPGKPREYKRAKLKLEGRGRRKKKRQAA